MALVETRPVGCLPNAYRDGDCAGCDSARAHDGARGLVCAGYARVSSADQKSDLDRQMQRLRDYAAAKGYTVSKEVSELA